MAEETKQAGADMIARLQNQFVGDKLKTAQSSLSGAQASLQGLIQQRQSIESQLQGIDPSNNDIRVRLQNQLADLNKNITSTQGQVNTYQSQVNDPTSMISAQERELIKGSQFGSAILGEGLTRLGADEQVKEVLGRFKDQSQGYNAQELQAQRELMNQEINRGGQTQMRALQAQLARSGVKGGVAGGQLRDVALGTLQQKANVEKQLFVENAAARERGLQSYASALGETKMFDIGQEQAEKNIILQSGMGFAQMGSAERIGKMQAEAAKQAAAAQAAAACFTGETEIEMEDGSYKKIAEICLGDLTSNGKVTAIGKAYAFAPIYFYRGEYCTGSHIVEESGKWIRVEDSQDAIKTLLDDRTIVYPMDVEGRFYYTKNGLKSYNFTEIEGSCDYEESLRRLNAQRNNVSGVSI